MKKNDPLQKAIVTVAEMARMVGLSRARFYGLMNEGVFPKPSRKLKSKRPFFDQRQQEHCLEIRKRNCGANGRPVLFYGRRLDMPSLSMNARRKSLSRSPQASSKSNGDPMISKLRQGLEQLGLSNLTEQSIRSALSSALPDGHQGVAHAELLMTVFRELKRQNSPDNLAR
jgi:predicted DNA-binding transcriptional regulator AlpA